MRIDDCGYGKIKTNRIEFKNAKSYSTRVFGIDHFSIYRLTKWSGNFGMMNRNVGWVSL